MSKVLRRIVKVDETEGYMILETHEFPRTQYDGNIIVFRSLSTYFTMSHHFIVWRVHYRSSMQGVRAENYNYVLVTPAH